MLCSMVLVHPNPRVTNTISPNFLLVTTIGTCVLSILSLGSYVPIGTHPTLCKQQSSLQGMHISCNFCSLASSQSRLFHFPRFVIDELLCYLLPEMNQTQKLFLLPHKCPHGEVYINLCHCYQECKNTTSPKNCLPCFFDARNLLAKIVVVVNCMEVIEVENKGLSVVET